MARINVSLPEELKRYVEGQVEEGDHASGSEFVRVLICKDKDRRDLRGALLYGARSPVVARGDSEYFARLRYEASSSL